MAEEKKAAAPAKSYPVITGKEKKAAADALLAQMKACDTITEQAIKIRRALGAKFREIGNNDKMHYTDRETGQSQKFGVSPKAMEREDGRIKEGKAAIGEALKAL